MASISTINSDLTITARRNVDLPISFQFTNDDGTALSGFAGYGITIDFADALGNKSPNLTPLNLTPDTNGNYYMRNNTTATVTCLIGAAMSANLKPDKIYYLQIYLTTSGKAVKDSLVMIKFEPGVIG